MSTYDVAVVGGGPAGLSAAMRGLLGDGKVPDHNLFYRLDAAGLVREERGAWRRVNSWSTRRFTVTATAS